MKNRQNFFLTLLILAGANIAYGAGSGFGSGQEVMQYFTSYGYYGLIGIIISAGLWILFDNFVLIDSRKYKLKTLRSVYEHYCGKWLGMALFIFLFFYLFSMAAIMIAGSGAAFHQYFDISPIFGRIIMTVLIFITSILGLKKTVNVIGSLGPIIIVFVLLIGFVSLVNSQMSIGDGMSFIENNELLKPSNNWIIAAIMYFSFASLFRATYMNGLANTSEATTKELVFGNTIGSILFAISVIVIILAQIVNIEFLYDAEIPNLALGTLINPVFGIIFGVILLFAIFTTAVPLVWSVSNIISKEGSKYYPWVITIVSIVAFFIGGLASFSVLVNIVTTIAAYVGVLYFIPALIVRYIIKPREKVE